MGVWEEGLSIPLISGITEHESLISCTKVFFLLGEITVNGSSDVGILCFNLEKYLTLVTVKTLISSIITDLLAHSASNLFEVDELDRKSVV